MYRRRKKEGDGVEDDTGLLRVDRVDQSGAIGHTTRLLEDGFHPQKFLNANLDYERKERG